MVCQDALAFFAWSSRLPFLLRIIECLPVTHCAWSAACRALADGKPAVSREAPNIS